MLGWLYANAATIVISAVLLAVVALIVRGLVTKRITGCGGDCSACGSGCNVCPHAEACHAERKKGGDSVHPR